MHHYNTSIAIPGFCRGVFLLIAVSVWGLTGSALAQGILIPREPDITRPVPRPLPRPVPLPHTLKVKSVKVTTTIKNQVARTSVEQIFLNETPATLEGTYCFPIPENAALSEFAIWDGPRRLVGEVVEKNKARQIYNDIVRTMRDPGLLEYVGKDLFQASVFPIPGNSEKKIELVYSQVLTAENGLVAYRYPLASGQRAMGAPAQTVAGVVEIDSQIPVKTVYSPSHSIDLKRDGERKARLSFESGGTKAAEDFQLYYGLSDKDFGVSLLTHREPGKDGYFLMLVAPKVVVSERERLTKEIVFVFDTSGSMSGEKIEKAKNALRFGLNSLGGQDRFNVIKFSGEEHLFENGLIQATPENIRRATEYVNGFRAEGGTNIHDSLAAALKLFPSNSENTRMIVFMTDGLPTVGPTDPNAIEQMVKKSNAANVRLFTFGVGYDVNTRLLDALAQNNRGVSDYIEPNEDLEVRVSNFFGRVNYPVLSDTKLDFGSVTTDYVYPRSLPDLFRGGQLVVVGRYRNDSDRKVTVKLTGNVQGREQVFGFEEQAFPRVQSENEFLPKLWATRRVGALMEQIRQNGEHKELTDEIIDLGTRYGIVTPYTSYLATEDNYRPGQPITAQNRPAPMVSGGLGAGSGGRAREGDRRDQMAARKSAPGGVPGSTADGVMSQSNSSEIVAVTGESAVRVSKETAKLKDADKAERYESSTVRTVGKKTFRLLDDVWTDDDFKPEAKTATVEVKFGSDAYFALLQQKPKLADFFALGTRVVVVFEGKVYVVKE
ncbi:MAG: VWA domain-containing protein [Blastocatellia bacterium]|nr:VWA domain-containing protein [Blastocatellia bacterium]